jgi:drug/metabolite transporter (DMT)-like permease
MSIVTLPTLFIFSKSLPINLENWQPVIFLTLVTFLSRLTLFQGIKKLGGTQTALLGISELLVSIIVGKIWFHDSLLPLQWIGAVLLLSSIALISIEKISPEQTRGRGGILGWLSPPDIRSRIPWGLDN